MRGLVGNAVGEGDDETVVGTFPGGATLRRGATGWVYLDERPDAGLGRALVWADREKVAELHLIADDGATAGVLARRATAFRRSPTVWRVEGRSLAPAAPAPAPVPREPPAVAREQVALLVGAGVEVITEHGEICGEILGLEVARVVVDDADDGPLARVEVGVGRHDRDAFTMVHGQLPTPEALAAVVDKVRRHRQRDAEAPPLGRLAAERWLRSMVLAQPGVVGATGLQPTEATLVRGGLKDVAPAVALGEHVDGGAVVVACSVGIDLDLVPAAADARLVNAPDARLVVVVPERDDHPVTRRLAAALARPAEIVTVPSRWRRSLVHEDPTP